jgi:hypothetical protein
MTNDVKKLKNHFCPTENLNVELEKAIIKGDVGLANSILLDSWITDLMESYHGKSEKYHHVRWVYPDYEGLCNVLGLSIPDNKYILAKDYDELHSLIKQLGKQGKDENKPIGDILKDGLK